MDVVYTLNDKFSPQVGASIASVCENNKGMGRISFWLLTVGGDGSISDENRKRFETLAAGYGRMLSIIVLDDLRSYFDFEFDTNGWNPIVLLRLLIERVLPAEIDKVLYLDGDTVCRGNLDSLWADGMDGKALGASIEPTVDRKRKESLGLGNSHYYNAGVLLINLKRWREGHVGDRIIDYYREHGGRLFASDQDAINGCLKDEIYTLSPKYNYCNIFDQYSYRFLRKLEQPAEYVSRDVFTEARKDPLIIHYLGEDRPWRRHNTHKYRDDYRHYLNLTEWRDAPDEEGWGLYFFCWRIFNFVTFPFNRVRYEIINFLIPAVMKKRAGKLVTSGEK